MVIGAFHTPGFDAMMLAVGAILGIFVGVVYVALGLGENNRNGK